jgi:SAM-dependent methyltransferase
MCTEALEAGTALARHRNEARPGRHMGYQDFVATLNTARMTVVGSLALVGGRYSPGELERSIRSKYSDPVELAAAQRYTAEGLTPGEGRLLHGHLPPRAQLLDIGCATGRVSLALQRGGARVIGVDINEAMIRTASVLARDAASPVDFGVMDARALGFRSESFDAVLMIGSVICYVRGRRNRVQAFREVHRVLRPGGTFFVVTPSRESSWKFRVGFAALALIHRSLRRLGRDSDWEPGDRFGPAWSGDPTRLLCWHMYSPRELRADLAAAGLTVIEAFPDAYMMSFVARRS